MRRIWNQPATMTTFPLNTQNSSWIFQPFSSLREVEIRVQEWRKPQIYLHTGYGWFPLRNLPTYSYWGEGGRGWYVYHGWGEGLHMWPPFLTLRKVPYIVFSRHKSKRSEIICPKSSRIGSKNLINDKNPISGCLWQGADRREALGTWSDRHVLWSERQSKPTKPLTKAVHFTVWRYDSCTNSVWNAWASFRWFLCSFVVGGGQSPSKLRKRVLGHTKLTSLLRTEHALCTL